MVEGRFIVAVWECRVKKQAHLGEFRVVMTRLSGGGEESRGVLGWPRVGCKVKGCGK